MTWRRVLLVTSWLEALALLIAGLAIGDAESLAFGAGVGAATAVLYWRPSRVAMAIRALIFVDVGFFMSAGLVTNIAHHEGVTASLVPIVLATTSLVGLAATVGVVVTRRDARAQATRVWVALPLLAVAAAVVLVVVNRGNGDARHPGDLVLTAKDAKFSAVRLVAPAGTVNVDLSNHDLFWHTFTIDSLHVDERIPVDGHHRVSFTAAPGVYRFYCAIPGHAAIGMSGTLVVH